MKDPVFLAIDNILPDGESEVEADFYLDSEFPKGSRIFITSRSESILRNLVSDHTCSFSFVIEYMPALEFEEARDIFVRTFPDLRKQGFVNVEDDVNECVRMCTIHEMVYHPLMLQSLAASIRWYRVIPNLDWKGKLAKLRSEVITLKENAWRKVFSMFNEAYALLTVEAQRVFLELVLFDNAGGYGNDMYKWIRIVHPHLRKTEMDNIILQLQDLCFVEKEGCKIKILDLLVEYGKFNARRGVHPEFVVVDGEHCWDDALRRARTVSISRWGLDTRKSSKLDLRDMEGVKVLHIVDNAGLQEVLLRGTTCAHLRSLIVRVPEGTSLLCTCDGGWSSPGAYNGGCLEWVRLQGNVCFRSLQSSERRVPVSPSNAFFGSLRNLELSSVPAAMDLVSGLGDLQNLEDLILDDLPSVQSINVSTCANLKLLKLSHMKKLGFISGLENTSLENVNIMSCDKMLALIIPADSKTKFSISYCRSLKRISFSTMPSYCAGAYSGCTESGLSVRGSYITTVDGLSQYTGCFDWQGHFYRWEERFGDLLKLDDGVDYSVCKAEIDELVLTGYNPAGLAAIKVIHLRNAKHAGLILSALFMAQPEDLQSLSIICCDKGGDCGCDVNVPHFGPLPTRLSSDKFVPTFLYHCPQVKELASLAQWHVLKCLELRGCTNVEVWPDFAAMTSLERLDLTDTSLKEWPAGVLHLPHLKFFDVRACLQLPAEELMKVVTFELQPTKLGIVPCIICSLVSLRDDLKCGRRDKLSIADALDGIHPELIVLFGRASCWSLHEVLVLEIVVAIMYNLWWFGAVDAAQDLGMREKMRRVLCSKSFLSLPFCACRQSLFLLSSSLPQLSTRKKTHWLVYNTSVLLSFPICGGGEWEPGLQHHARRGMGWMGMALVGGASLAYFNASLDDDLRDSIINFDKYAIQMGEEVVDDIYNSTLNIPNFLLYSDKEFMLDMFPLEEKEDKVLKRRVWEARSRLALELGILDRSSSNEVGFSADFSYDERDSGFSRSYRDLVFGANGTLVHDRIDFSHFSV